MSKGQHDVVSRYVHTLFNAGTVAGLTDQQLLERFRARSGEAAELAFAALVERHGPMVLRVCRSVLRDPHEAHDAFQATFLVLVRRAGSLWVRESLGPWLHQVAYRVASCARSAGTRRWRH
jgi:DNA-directed RNA polymerase specialized sigma24 family protein